MREDHQTARIDARDHAYQCALREQRRHLNQQAKPSTATALAASADGSGRMLAARPTMPSPRNRRSITSFASTAPVHGRAPGAFQCAPLPLPPDLALPGHQSLSLHTRLVSEAVGRLGKLSRRSLLELKSYAKQNLLLHVPMPSAAFSCAHVLSRLLLCMS